MRRIVVFRSLLLSSLLTATLAAQASGGLLGSLKDAASSQLGGQSGAVSGASSSALGGLGLPALSSSTAGNAAGVLQYCIQNKYLGASGAAGVKDALLGKIGLGGQQAQQDSSAYQSGVAGVLSGADGSSFNLQNLQSTLKTRACDYVLDNAKSFL